MMHRGCYKGLYIDSDKRSSVLSFSIELEYLFYALLTIMVPDSDTEYTADCRLRSD